MTDNFLQELERKALEIKEIGTAIENINKTREQKLNECNLNETAWKESKESFTKQVKEGVISTGNPISDYIFTQNDFFGADNFKESFTGKVEKVTNLLELISQTKTFWHSKTEGYGSEQTKIYELLFLKDTPYTISPNQLTIHAKSSLELRLEPVFLGQVVWPFITKDNSEKTLQVKPEGMSSIDYLNDIQFTGNQTRVQLLEKSLEENPIVLGALKSQIAHQISPDLQKTINQQIHTIAEQTLNIIKDAYSAIKSNDAEIQKIEEQYNPSHRDLGEYRRIPVVVEESDSFMAKIMSYDARTKKAREWKTLARCIDDLDRTGLADYTQPIEINIMAGEKRILNLSETSQYIRNILEIKVRASEAEMRPQTSK